MKCIQSPLDGHINLFQNSPAEEMSTNQTQQLRDEDCQLQVPKFPHRCINQINVVSIQVKALHKLE